MTDKVVSDNLNIYDVFGRLGPGCIVVALFYYCYKNLLPDVCFESNYSILILYLFLSYIIGSINQAFVRWSVSHLLNKHYFGGNPRELFTDPPIGEKVVLKHVVSRELAKKNRDIIVLHFGSMIHKDFPNTDNGDASSAKAGKPGNNGSDTLIKVNEKEANHFAFGYMTNYLDIKGLGGKNSRINSLADMCASVAITAVICLLIWIIPLVILSTPSAEFWISLIIGLIVFVFVHKSACKLYRSYIQMRYAIVVYQFAISNVLMQKEYLNEDP